MRHVPTLVRRELGAYFLSPMAFLVLLAFQGIACLNFWELIDALSRPQQSFSTLHDPMIAYISGSAPFWFGILFAVPVLTMRLLSEEKRSGTMETLLTAPVTEAEIVAAKWLAGSVMFWVLLLPFAIYLPFLRHQGKFPFDPGPVAAVTIGLTSLGMMFVSIGLFFSALTKNQIVAAIWTFVVLFMIVILTRLASVYATAQQLSWAEGVKFVAVLDQVRLFGEGMVDPRFVALHLSVCAFMLYLSVKIVQTRRVV